MRTGMKFNVSQSIMHLSVSLTYQSSQPSIVRMSWEVCLTSSSAAFLRLYGPHPQPQRQHPSPIQSNFISERLNTLRRDFTLHSPPSSLLRLRRCYPSAPIQPLPRPFPHWRRGRSIPAPCGDMFRRVQCGRGANRWSSRDRSDVV